MRSRPARARGLKRIIFGLIGLIVSVAPRAGAWIETWPSPLRLLLQPVAPRAGAWIETGVRCIASQIKKVAPRAGAWIETFQTSKPCVM